MVGSPHVSTHMVPAGGEAPNCSLQKLPLLIYRQAFPADSSPDKLASEMEATFEANGYPPQWRYGLYPYHHYHSTSHEVLGVFKGSARVRFGGDSEVGVEDEMSVGDVIVVPAGVLHRGVEMRDGFNMVGAYPRGRSWDMKYGKPEELREAEANMAGVPVPATDPVYGDEGPLLELWGRK